LSHSAAGPILLLLVLQASLNQYNTCKTLGALLSQLAALPEKQLQHWWLSRQKASAAASSVGDWNLEEQHVEAISQLLQECCGAFSGVQPVNLNDLLIQFVQAAQGCAANYQLFNPAGDPVGQLLQWVVGAMGQQQQQQRGQEEEEHEEGQAQQQQQHRVHPAEALRQLLDVLLSALQYRHVLSMQQ
jgi:hypothetical protein